MYVVVYFVFVCFGCGVVGVRICRSVCVYLCDYRLCVVKCWEVKIVVMVIMVRSFICIGIMMVVRFGVV